MARIIAVTNQKGGVGKTTTCINLGASLAAMKRRVLLVDIDPQGNATTGSGLDKHSCGYTIYDILVDGRPAKDVVYETERAGYDIIAANGDVTAAEVDLMSRNNRERLLETALAPIDADYDFILIDCPPSLNMLTVNALIAADSVMIPMQCEFYALEGLAALMNTIEQIRENANPSLRIEGLLRTMYDPRNSLTRDVSQELENHFGSADSEESGVYSAVIPRNVRLAEAPSHGLPVLHYDKSSKGAKAYLAVAGELLRRHDALQQKYIEEAEPA